jgi:hypothetical protein
MPIDYQEDSLSPLVPYPYLLKLSSASPKKITLDRLDDMIGKVRSTVIRLLNDGITFTELPHFYTYEELKSKVPNDISPDRLRIAIDNYGDPVDDVAPMTTNVHSYLKDNLPYTTSKTLFGLQELEPSDYDKFKFTSSANIAINPSLVLPLMLNGNLTIRQVETLKLLHPSFYEAIKQIVFEEFAKQPEDAKLGMAETALFSRLLGVQRLTPSLLQTLQQQTTKEEEKSPSPSGSKFTNSLATPTQEQV